MPRRLTVKSLAAIALALPALSGLHARAQTEERPDRPAKEAAPTEGFWPTRLMMDRFFDRLVEDMAERYDLDDDQIERTREVVKERIPKFLQDNRAQIQTLMNQFIEAQLGTDAPEVDFVTKWAQKAMPLIDEFKGVIDDSTAAIREHMTEEQQLQLDSEKAAFDVGIDIARNKVGLWSEGGFDPSDWPRDREQKKAKEKEEKALARQRMEEAKRDVLAQAGRLEYEEPQALADAAPGGEDAAAMAAQANSGQRVTAAQRRGQLTVKTDDASKKDEWTRYVEDFVARYELDDSQQNSAWRFLDRRKEERTAYLKKPRTLDRMESIEKLFHSESADDRAKGQKELASLNEPIDRMFTQLKDELDKLPTRAQRAKAGTKTTRATPARPGRANGTTRTVQPAVSPAETDGP